MTPEQASENIDQLARRAYEDLLRRIRAGESPRAAAEAALAAFRGPYYDQIADALSAILLDSIGPAAVKAWPVGRVKLSQALYTHHRAISAATAATVNAHLKGLHSARDLAKTLYEGYEFKPDTLRVVAKLPQYLRVEFDRAKAARLKTPALRAAYLQAIRQAEAGAGQAALEKVLKVAFYERNRYLANRIAQTEIHRAQAAQIAREIMDDEQIGFVQYRMSSTHKIKDICDLRAQLDAYGLGPGVYPKAEAPLPPLHPFCRCLLRPLLSIPPDRKVKAKPNAARAFLKALPAVEARQVMGGQERLRRVLEDGDSVEDVVNTNVDPLYHARRMGDALEPAGPVGQDGRMGNTKSIADPATIRQFLESDRADPIPVAVLPVDIREQLGVDTDRILLSRYTADKQRKHPEITADSYEWLQDLLDRGERIAGKPFHVVVIQHRGEWFVAVLKATRAGDEVYLQSFRRSDAKDIAKLRGENKK